MNKTQDITIVLLLVCAAVLGTLLVGAYSSTGDRAFAAGTTRAGNYLMCTGFLSETMDLLYVIDVGARRLNVYGADDNKMALDLVQDAGVDLSKAFQY